MKKWGIKMALNKTILKKIAEKTKDDKEQQDIIVSILDEENKGIGQFKKKYKAAIQNAINLNRVHIS